ncbi:hypothetical protein HXX76_016347, partial [Chlamydomonas incerta]
WREVPNNTSAASRLTPELKDLLDKMFDVKQESRASIESIKNSSWFQKPLPEPYASSLKELQEEQRSIDEQVIKGAFQSAERDKALEALLDRAVTPALPTEDVTRLSLSKIKRAYSILKGKGGAGAGMAAVAEEE